MSGKAQPEAGRRFEYKVRDDLQANGYWVMRSPASKSPVDMVAIKPRQVLFVQAKRDGRLDPDEWNTLFKLALSAGALPVLACRGAERRVVILYQELLALKTGRAPQPWRPFVLDEAA
jgi:Holliday junction resolvase